MTVTTQRHRLITGGSRAARLDAVQAEQAASPGSTLELAADLLPFQAPGVDSQGAGSPRLIIISDAERAFPNQQTSGTRLVLTQSTYTIQKWLDHLAPADRLVVAGDAEALEYGAPEALRGHGPWRHFEIVDLCEETSPSSDSESRASESASGLEQGLARAYALADSDERVRQCQRVQASHPESAVAALALASACRETQELERARHWLEEAIRLAPHWEAAHYEAGKFWLGAENMERASECFRRAGELMPTFSAAFGNLGATLGELNQPEAALDAFTKALESDPDNITIINNIGVVCRELGRLEVSIASLRRVVAEAPEFVFGHYNLGHSLLLSGQPQAALEAYEEGQHRDPQRNRRQGCRLAVVRFANGDVAGAERDLLEFSSQAPPEEREDLLLEAYEIAAALLESMPGLEPHRKFLERIAAEVRGVY